VTQPGGKSQPDLGIHLDLVDAVHLVFDRVLDGDDLFVRQIDRIQGTVQRRGLPASRRSGHKKNPVWAADQRFQVTQGILGKASLRMS